jgi:hypothetical protein
MEKKNREADAYLALMGKDKILCLIALTNAIICNKEIELAGLRQPGNHDG